MLLLDTTVLVYAVGSKHPLRESCRGVLELVREGYVSAATTVEVVQEFLHVRAARRPRADAAALARRYAVGLSPLVRPDDDDLMAGLDLFERYSELGAFDAVLAGCASRRRWSLVSADAAFARIDSLRHLNPASPTFLDEVRRPDG